MVIAVKLLDIALEALHAHKLLENAKVSHWQLAQLSSQMCQIMKLTWLMLLSRLILALGDYPNSSASCKSSEPFSTQLRMVMVLQDR
jgi:hypothetical protein